VRELDVKQTKIHWAGMDVLQGHPVAELGPTENPIV